MLGLREGAAMSGATPLDTGKPDIASEEYWEDFDDAEDTTCQECGGSGADSWESFMPCEACDGQGYKWWL